MKRLYGLISMTALLLCSNMQLVHAQENLGMVAMQSVHQHYMQAKSNGEVHADNTGRYGEETWYLVRVNAAKGIYAFVNYKNGRVLTSDGSMCVTAEISPGIGPMQQWTLISGRPYGVINAAAFRNVGSKFVLGAGEPGKAFNRCKGQVHAFGEFPNLDNHEGATWGGWWFLSAATKPDDNSYDPFVRLLGKTLGDIGKEIAPAVLAALLM